MASDHDIEVRNNEINRTAETHPRDVKNILNSLPVIQPTRNNENAEMKSILDFVVQESEETSPEEEGPVIRAFLTGMNWATYVLAIGVVLFLTWAAGDGIMKYLAHK